MCMEMPLGMGLAIGGTLMKAHGVREKSFEELVVARRQVSQYVRQSVPLGVRKFVHAAKMPLTDHDRLKRPHSPKRHEGGECFVLANEALRLLFLYLPVLAQQTRAVSPLVGQQRCLFLGEFVRHSGIGPYLAVRVR